MPLKSYLEFTLRTHFLYRIDKNYRKGINTMIKNVLEYLEIKHTKTPGKVVFLE